ISPYGDVRSNLAKYLQAGNLLREEPGERSLFVVSPSFVGRFPFRQDLINHSLFDAGNGHQDLAWGDIYIDSAGNPRQGDGRHILRNLVELFGKGLAVAVQRTQPVRRR